MSRCFFVCLLVLNLSCVDHDVHTLEHSKTGQRLYVYVTGGATRADKAFVSGKLVWPGLPEDGFCEFHWPCFIVEGDKGFVVYSFGAFKGSLCDEDLFALVKVNNLNYEEVKSEASDRIIFDL